MLFRSKPPSNRCVQSPRSACLLTLLLVLLGGGATAQAATVIRGPYLQVGTPESVILRWRTDVPTVSRVDYGTQFGILDLQETVIATTTDHEVTLSGLTPGTRYYYGVGSFTQILAGDDITHFFDTPPLVGTPDPMRFWILGDSGTANADAMAVRDAYYAYTGTTHTDLWLMLGDNAYSNGTDVEYQAAVFDIYPEMLRKSVLWPTRGNHDAFDSANQLLPYYDIFNLPTAAEAGGLASGSEAYYSFDWANIHFVVLDSQGSDRTPDGPMLTWMAQDLAMTDQDWVIAYWHHPPYSKGIHDSDNAPLEQQLIDMRENALPILEAHGVDAVFGGHSHNYERSYLIDGHYGLSGEYGIEHEIDDGDGRADGDGAYRKPVTPGVPNQGTVYTVAGNAGKVTGGPLDHPAMYIAHNVVGSVIVDVSGNTLDATFLDANGDSLDHFTIVKDLELAADFFGTPLTGDAPLAVDFTDTSYGSPTGWAWDFDDDGQIDSTGQDPTHVYTLPGIYSVEFTSTRNSDISTRYKSDYVNVTLGPPQANFSASIRQGPAPLNVTFVDESESFPTSWEWDFDNDGNLDATGPSAIHTYTDPGLYAVSLSAGNVTGTDEETKLGFISVAPVLPQEITGLVIDGGTISWDALPAACSYDAFKGSLEVLRNSNGSFESSQIECLADDSAINRTVDGSNPRAGSIYYYLARGSECVAQTGTYDTSGLGQSEPRDPEIQTGTCFW